MHYLCIHPILSKCGALRRLFLLGFYHNLLVNRRNHLHTFCFYNRCIRRWYRLIFTFMKNITLFRSTTRLLLCAICLALLSPSPTFAQSAEQYLEQAYEAPPKSKERFDLFMKAAELGNAEAQWRIGDYYYAGLEVDKDYNKAFIWYKKSADQGYAKAQCKIGDCYFFSQGVDKDKNKAFVWYKKSADQGYAEAMCKLGQSYSFGWGVQEDDKMAERYLLSAAYKGYSQAYLELGTLYRYHLDNKNEAIYWYKKYVDYTYAERGEPSSSALESLRELGVYYHPRDNSASSNPQQTQTQTQTQQQAYTPEYGYRDVWVKCMTCGGSGQCQVCYGRGGYYSGNYFITCGGCNGTKVCPVCGGRGGYNEKQQYQIR